MFRTAIDGGKPTVVEACGRAVINERSRFESDEAVDYAFMGQNPDAADNRWLRDAFENQIPVIYFLGIAPGRYQAMLPIFIAGWDGDALKARIIFGVPDRRGCAASPRLS